MTLYIFDTDHITFYQNGDVNVGTRFDEKLSEQIAVTIISFEEQIRGRLAMIKRANSQLRKIQAYSLLELTLHYFADANVLSFDEAAADHFTQLRQQKLRVGSQDLQIAAIALANDAVVVTRNRRDFERVPNLVIEDWSIPLG